MEMIPAMTDFRAEGTIMGLAGLTAVFGMGTGVTPPVWSPEKRPPGGAAGAVVVVVNAVGQAHTLTVAFSDMQTLGRAQTDRRARPGGPRTDRGGQAARLLGPVG